MKSPSIPLIAELLRNALESNGVAPAEVAARVYPKPRRGPDQSSADRASFAEQLTRLVGPKPRPADCMISPRLAMALDRALGLPNAFCLLIAALDDAIHATEVESRFLEKIQPPDRPIDLACSYAVLVQLGTGRSLAFVDGRLPAGATSFPNDTRSHAATTTGTAPRQPTAGIATRRQTKSISVPRAK